MVFVITVRNMKFLCRLISNFLHQSHRIIGQGQGQGQNQDQDQDQDQGVQLQKYRL